MRINPYSLQRPAPVQETREFTDPLQPGVTLSLTLRARPDAVTESRIVTKTQRYIRDYVLGPGDGVPPAPLLTPDDQILTLDEPTAAAIAALEIMQVTEGDDKPYDLLEWLQIAGCMPSAFEAIAAFSNDLTGRARGTLKNASAGATETVSGPPSVTDSSTPRS